MLNLTSTFAACKNWNSHGATVGAPLRQLGALLASLETAFVGPLIDNDFRELIPIGNALTGQKHGHCDTVYVEYMTSVPEHVVARGEDCNYLDHARGARFIDGECKDTALNAHKGVLVLHAADQFGYKDSSLSMLTTSNGIKFSHAWKKH